MTVYVQLAAFKVKRRALVGWVIRNGDRRQILVIGKARAK